jgi:DNA repair protein RecN (Recombination protein N)
MLQSLSIRNVVLVDRLDLRFRSGLCALTGETGAGKSILLDALGLALGARGDAALIRQGAERATVTAEFKLDPTHPAHELLREKELEADGPLVLRRTQGGDGRSRAFINDQPVGIALLRQIGERLVEIQGHAESRSLLDPSTHRELLDSFGGLTAEAARLQDLYRAWKAAREELATAKADHARTRSDEEYLRHALAEIEALDPEEDEEEKLLKQRMILKNGAKLLEGINAALGELSRDYGVDSSLRAAGRRIEEVAAMAAGKLDQAIEALNRAFSESVEAIALLESAVAGLDLDPQRLDEIEDRLHSLRAIARKHGEDVASLPGLKERIAASVAAIEDRGDALAHLESKTQAAREAYRIAARALRGKRRQAAGKLDEAVGAELPPLKLDKAVFRTRLIELEESDWSATGMDRVLFEVSTNPGSAPGPIARIASAGELSRIMLALKVVGSGGSGAPTLIFDEVDTGIGGATAAAVGERLARLGRQTQVLVVTHSPQVAARADHHWRIVKQQAGDGYRTHADELMPEARRDEVARMLAGRQVTDEARAAADSLIAAPRS